MRYSQNEDQKIEKENGWKIQDDKWNPSDIQAVKPVAKNINLRDDSIEELNNHLL